VRDRIRQWQEQNAAVASPNPSTSGMSLLSAEDDRIEPERRKTRRASRGKEDPDGLILHNANWHGRRGAAAPHERE